MNRRWTKLCDGVTATVFLVALGLPLVLMSPSTWDAGAERREPAAMPAVGLILDDPAEFTAAAEDFFDDHFGLRRMLVNLRNLIDVHLFRASPTPLVIMGQGDWLFFAGDGAMEDYAGRRTLSAAEMMAWREAVARRRDALAAQGVTYVLAIAPNKQTVYPEFLPPGPRPGTTRAMQFAEALRGTELADTVVFLGPALIAAKDRGDLYQRLDSHWNARGAYVAYHAIMERVGHRFAPVTFPWEAFVPAPEQDRDLARMMGVSLEASGAMDPDPLHIPCIAVADFEGIDATPREELERLDAARTCAGAEGRMLLLHDSFGGAIWRYFAGGFARLRTHSRTVTADQLQRYVALERPDVVVELWVERTFDPR